MNRTIISKVGLKYDDVLVDIQPLIVELEPETAELTDAQVISAFFDEVVRLTNNTTTPYYGIQSSQIRDFPKVDNNHPNTVGMFGFKKSIGTIEALGQTLSIRMLNVVDGIEQATGFAIEDYTPKKIALEIYHLTPEQMQAELAVIQQSVPFEVHTPLESLYDLLKPFVPLPIPTLENVGYAKAVDDNGKIILYANAMQYIKMMA